MIEDIPINEDILPLFNEKCIPSFNALNKLSIVSKDINLTCFENLINNLERCPVLVTFIIIIEKKFLNINKEKYFKILDKIISFKNINYAKIDCFKHYDYNYSDEDLKKMFPSKELIGDYKFSKYSENPDSFDKNNW